MPSPLEFTDEIYQEAGSFLMTPFTEGCEGVIIKPCPLAARTCCALSPTAFSQFMTQKNELCIGRNDILW